MINYINKNKNLILETLIIGFIGFIIITFNKISFCQQAYEIGFDQQVFLYWDYLKSSGLIPIKDYFYPYGLLLHYKSIGIHFYLIYLVILFVISVVTFINFKFIFKDRSRTYLFYFIYSAFILLFVNPDTYVRYAPLVIFSFLISYFAARKKLISNFSGFIVGLSVGLFFSFINDIFFYSAFCFLIFTALYYLLNKKSMILSFKDLVGWGMFGLIGFLVGLLPILAYLISNNLIKDFFIYLESLNGFYQLAKVAFPPSLKSLENILIILSLIFSFFYIISKRRKTLNFKFYTILSLTLVILSLEQKNLVRSMYEQMSFISLITFLILLDEVLIKLKMKLNPGVLSLFMLNFLALPFLIIGVDRNFKFDKGRYSISETNISQCVDKKIKNINRESLVSHRKVVDYIDAKENVKIFSFPADPIFYVLLNQKPTYYPSIYEATPIEAQIKLIDYIKKNNVNYVIINTKTPAVQDNVPNEKRVGLLYEYILANYKKHKVIDNFLILKRT